MKLQTAINKLEKANFNIKQVSEKRIHHAEQTGKETIEINADSTETVYAVFHIWNDDKQIQKNLAQAIKFA